MQRGLSLAGLRNLGQGVRNWRGRQFEPKLHRAIVVSGVGLELAQLAAMRSIANPDSFIADVPHDLFDEARATKPVQWVEHGNSGFWSVTSHAAACEVLGDQSRFSSYAGSVFMEEQSAAALQSQRRMLLVMDPPQHTVHRLIVNRRFVPRAVERFRQQIAEIVTETVDRIAPLGRVDYVEAIAAEIPLLVIADLLGVEREARDDFHRWSDTIINAQDPEYAISSADVGVAIKELLSYGAGKLAERRAHPREDLLTALAHAEIHGQPYDVEGQAAFWYLFLLAGNETTRQALSGAMIAFDRFPGQKKLLAERPELLDGAVEEIVRWWSPVHHFCRTATGHETLAGQRIGPGDKLVVWFSAANRDPAVFSDPHRVDITRTPNPHLGFGQGTHFCLGAHVARLELRLTLAALMERLPDLALEGPPERARGNFVNAVKRMQVTFTPEAARR